MFAGLQQLCPGFSDSVLNSQQVFRQLLKAMSEPASICYTQVVEQCPAGLKASTYAVSLCLFDQDTCLKLSDSVDSEQIRQSLRFHNSVPFTDHWGQADFVICNEFEIPDLDSLNLGSEEFPDQSCTLIIQCESLTEGILYSASGPGIQGSRVIRCSALTAELVQQRESVERRFPLGIDLIFTSEQGFLCLPRTTALIAG